jgi:hypothetical protein
MTDKIARACETCKHESKSAVDNPCRNCLPSPRLPAWESVASAIDWKARRHSCRLEQDARGNWWLFINSSEHGIPASDVEVSLWLDLQDALKNVKETEF